MAPSVPKKTGVLICHHCEKPVRGSYVRLTHESGRGPPDVEMLFCDGDCMREHFWDEEITEEIDKKVQEERNWVHKQVCPACRRRIT